MLVIATEKLLEITPTAAEVAVTMFVPVTVLKPLLALIRELTVVLTVALVSVPESTSEETDPLGNVIVSTGLGMLLLTPAVTTDTDAVKLPPNVVSE